jgi:hypothetical protein
MGVRSTEFLETWETGCRRQKWRIRGFDSRDRHVILIHIRDAFAHARAAWEFVLF